MSAGPAPGRGTAAERSTPAAPGWSPLLRSVRVLRNVVTNYLRFFVTGAIAFLLTPVMVHLLGDGGYGLWVTVFSLTGYFGLFDQGIRPSLVRYISRDHAREDAAGMGRTLSSALALYGTVGAITLLFTLTAAGPLTRLLHIDPAQREVARIVILISGASMALGFPLGVFGAALSGLQRYDVANGIGIGIAVLRALAFVAVLRLGGGLVGLAWSSLAMNVLGHALSWISVRRLVPAVRVNLRLVTGTHLRMIGAYSGFAFVGALANSLAFQTDALVITRYLGAALVTPFALAAGLVDNARSLVYSATWVLSPTASELETRGESSKLHAMVIAGSKYSILVSWPVLIALLVFGENLLTTWVGPGYAGASTLLVILAVPTLIALPQSAASSVLYGVSRHRGVVLLAILNAVLNLGLSVWWARSFGVMGVAFGTAVPLLLVSGVATIVYTCRALSLPIRRYLREGMLRPGLVALAFLAPALAIQWLWHPLGWGPLALAVAVSWLLFAAAAWRFGVTAAERGRWARMVPRLFGRTDPARVGSAGDEATSPAIEPPTPRVSVVIAAYNAAWCIENALQSTLAQTRPPHEVIVCDDGSTDGTPDLVERRFGARVRVLRLPHRNASASRSIGIAQATGDWIAFLDADDVWTPDKLEVQFAVLAAHPEVRWISSDGRLVSDHAVIRESWLAEYFSPVRDSVGDLLPALLERCFPLVSSMLVEKRAYDAAGGLDTELCYSYDYDLWIRLACLHSGALTTDRIVDYFAGPGTLSRRLEARHRDDLVIMERLAAGTPPTAPRLRRRAAERASGIQFDLALICLRSGRRAEARERLQRAAEHSPWNRRLVAWGGWLLPEWATARLMKSDWIKGKVEGVRHRKIHLQTVVPRADPA
jgi:O-antigen/teichoic acid export membrane protein